LAEHKITIQNRIAQVKAGIELICNNPTDTIRFEFDDEWSGYDIKTARFSWEGKHIDVPFSGNTVQIPEIFRTNYVFVGVFTNAITSTAVKVKCRYSIKCMGGKVVVPSDDVYARIISLIEELSEKGATDSQIASAVDKYLQENPVQAGATEEQAAQIAQNAHDIAELKQSGGISGENGATFTPTVSEDGVLSWTNDKGLTNPAPANIKGEPGMSGADGTDGYTPVRGTDYWTDEDIAAIRDYLDDATSEHAAQIEQNRQDIAQLKQSGGTGGGVAGADGEDGATFIPSVSEDGVLSWTNDKGLNNPEPVNIKGLPGDPGVSGSDGLDGSDGVTFTPTVSEDGILSWSNDGGLDNPDPVNIKGVKGDTGSRGATGASGYTPVRGTDYWTASDIATIKSYVDDAILGGEW